MEDIKLEMPYFEKVKLTDSRNAKYYVSLDSKIRGNRNIPLRCLTKKSVEIIKNLPKKSNSETGKEYIIRRMKNAVLNDNYKYDTKGRLITNHKELIIANPSTKGTPRYWVVNFQDIWSQNTQKEDRNNKAIKLSKLFEPYIESLSKIKYYPLRVELYIYSKYMPVDISNKGPVYFKVFLDTLKEKGIIIDDSAKYITEAGRTKWIESYDEEEKMIWIIGKSW